MPYLLQGQLLPAFHYDAPYAAQQPVAELYARQPAVIVFLSNFGHPITREVVKDYLTDYQQLSGCRLACVVRSRHESVEQALQGHELPFTLICDAEGALYEHFEIPQEANPLRCISLRAAAILRRAKKEGYSPAKGQPQQLPLTLVVGTEGRILFAHYGQSLTDLPESCAAVSQLAAQAVEAWQQEQAAPQEAQEGPEEALPEEPQEEPAPEAEPAAEMAAQPAESENTPAGPAEEPEAPEAAEPAEQAAQQTLEKYQAEGFTLESFFSTEPKEKD